MKTNRVRVLDLVKGITMLLLATPVIGQTQIDWTGVSGDGFWSGTVAGVPWELTITNADSVGTADGGLLLRGNIGGNNPSATYRLEFPNRPVHIVWMNDALPVIGGLAGSSTSLENVEIVGGADDFRLVDNSRNITAPPAASVAPRISVPAPGDNWRAGAISGTDHAYYLARSRRPVTVLEWTHSNNQTKAEVWRVGVLPCIDWSGIDGNGVWSGTVDDIPWQLTVADATSVTADPSDPTILRGFVTGGTPVTYNLAFRKPVSVIFDNTTTASVGGLAGQGGSDEMVDIVNGVGNYILGDNSTNIASPPGRSMPPVMSVVGGTDLRAERVVGLDHAYYRALSRVPQTALNWVHSNTVAKAEAWRVCVSACGMIDWATVSGNGTYSDTVTNMISAENVAWELTVTNADLVQPNGADNTLLFGRIAANQTATYEFTVSASDVVWMNINQGNVGGLAGAGFSDEKVSIAGGGTPPIPPYEFRDNSANILSPPASSVAPTFSTNAANDLIASSTVDHAYYLGQSTSPQSALDWIHTNNTVKGELWAACVSCPAVSGTPDIRVGTPTSKNRVTWAPLPHATAYAVVKGTLSVLRSTAGDFASATDGCIAEDVNDNTGVSYAPDPPLGEAFFFLVRAVQCQGNGTYDSGGIAQVGARDAGVAASANDCP